MLGSGVKPEVHTALVHAGLGSQHSDTVQLAAAQVSGKVVLA